MPKDTEAATIGHNSTILVTEDQFHAFKFRHIDAQAKLEKARAEKNKLRKEMKAAGINLGDFDAHMRLTNLSRDEAQDHLNHLAHYLRWSRVPLGEQIPLDLGVPSDPLEKDDDAAIQHIVEDAIKAGFLAGLSGHPDTENPHDGNTDAGQAWIGAHRDGLAKRDLEIDPMGSEDTDD